MFGLTLEGRHERAAGTWSVSLGNTWSEEQDEGEEEEEDAREFFSNL